MLILFPDQRSKAKNSKPVTKKKFDHEKQLRCNDCENCKAKDCGECIYCKEMFKFGGEINPTYQDKDNCVQRQCKNLVTKVEIKKEYDITDLKDQPGDFDDAETNDNGKISLIFLPYLSPKIP